MGAADPSPGLAQAAAELLRAILRRVRAVATTGGDAAALADGCPSDSGAACDGDGADAGGCDGGDAGGGGGDAGGGDGGGD
jgi:hypothetical protein